VLGVVGMAGGVESGAKDQWWRAHLGFKLLKANHGSWKTEMTVYHEGHDGDGAQT
jgi:hypothetical protein